MKLLLLWLLFPLLAGAQTPFAYQLKGKIGPQPAAAKVYLLYNGQLLDSTRLKSGVFEFRGTSQVPKRAQVVLSTDGRTPNPARAYGYDAVSIFLEPGLLLVSSSDAVLHHATVKGSPATRDYQRFMQQDAALAEQLYPHQPNKVHIITWEQSILNRQRQRELAMKFIRDNPTLWASLDLLVQPSYLGPPQYHEVAPLY
jgi:hypothetical protein